ncbi:MAG: ATP-dependent Clp protease adaptor ClpS [Nitrospira sp.]|nr:ATP-dependent Clp protease adaptor ClpS [Nitrospira sp.]MDH4369691.1 ATP-dependent Clp protease adaptor ClpS [Nitrospira sp.]MDH5348919.1 ATP-dependent Clp protease adaptor ClpS [Nitrospira sp.]MDH5497469.1 ATP-dependent Clp protease adaptor ClpS [Nitrospira sp.]MDH5724647.1 ATP-dependent Clp protease adaptor ClpS [Nitrospira sp.]
MPTPATPETIPDITEDIQTGSGTGFESRVVVYNCDCHTYQQVIELFCRFIPGMSSTKAFELAYRIDHDGEAIVFTGTTEHAESIAVKLAGGGLKVAVQ